MKLGKLAPRRRLKIPALGDYLDKATFWPAVPPQGWEFAVPADQWGMLGNDQYGDCTCAGLIHLLQAQSANAGAPLHGTTEQALALYTAVTGFDPNNAATDQGAACTDVLNYWQKTGVEVTDASGNTVTNKIVGYASLDVSSYQQVRYAVYTFGGAYIGINLPAACESNTANWNFGPGESIAGGHCVVIAGQGSKGAKIVSWGMVIPATLEFLASYMDEAYIVIDEAFLSSGKTPNGLDLVGLTSAMQNL